MGFRVSNIVAAPGNGVVHPGYVAMRLDGIAPWQRHLDGVGLVNHPPAMPRGWRTGMQLSPDHVRNGLGRGWQLARTTLAEGFSGERTYFLPPEPLLAALLEGDVYGALRSCGIVAEPREVHLPPAFVGCPWAPVDHLHNLLEAVCLAKVDDGTWRSEGVETADVADVVESGGLLLGLQGDRYLLDQSSLQDTGLTRAEIQAFVAMGLVQARWAERLTRPVVNGTALEQRAIVVQPLDLTAFAAENKSRWGADPFVPVIDERMLNKHPLRAYPELVKWLTDHRVLLEPVDLERIAHLFDRLEGAFSLQQQEGILNQIVGIMGELAVREELVRDYRRYAATEPNAVLLLEHQLASPDGRAVADAVLGALRYDTDGMPSMELAAIYEMSVSPGAVPHMDIQLRRALDERFASGIHVRGGAHVGRTLPVVRPASAPIGLEAWTVPAGAVERIRSIRESIRERAVARFAAPEWGPAREGASSYREQDTGAIRPGSPLDGITIETLDQWAAELGGSTTIVLRGGSKKDGRITGFAVDTKVPENISSTYFTVTLTRVAEVWQVEAVGGRRLPRVVETLRQVAGLHVPSNEWLSRDHTTTLSEYTTTEALAQLTLSVLDRWAAELGGSATIVLRGDSEKDGRITGFAVDTKVPENISSTYFTVTLTRAAAGWHVAAVGGQSLTRVLEALRQVSALSVPSNEWLSRGLRFTLSEYTTMDTLAQLTPSELDRWAYERQSNTLVLCGRVKKDGTIIRFAVDTKVPGGGIDPNYFTVTLTRVTGVWQVATVGGRGLTRVLEALRRVPGLHVPPDEKLRK